MKSLPDELSVGDHGIKPSQGSGKPSTMALSGPSASGSPVEATGVSLALGDDRVRGSRGRSERIARYGRNTLVMLGAITAGAAAALGRLHPSGLADGILVFGVVLIALGVVQHLWLRRDRDRWPEQAYLWADGVELVLHNGEVRAVEWNDPKLALDLFCRPIPGDPPTQEILLEWKMDGYVPPCPLSPDGFERLRTAAIAHGLGMAEFRHGPRQHEIRIYELRPPRRSSAPAPSSPGRAPVDP